MTVSSTRRAVTLFFLGLGLLATQIAAIYPEGHFNFVTKITDEAQLHTLIDDTLAADKTLMVRWIASEGWGWWRKQAPSWNDATRSFVGNKDVVFADINLSEAPIRGDYNPGAGGWPTIRYFNKKTGKDGAPYDKKTDKSMCDEVSERVYKMVSFIFIVENNLMCCHSLSGCTPT